MSFSTVFLIEIPIDGDRKFYIRYCFEMKFPQHCFHSLPFHHHHLQQPPALTIFPWTFFAFFIIMSGSPSSSNFQDMDVGAEEAVFGENSETSSQSKPTPRGCIQTKDAVKRVYDWVQKNGHRIQRTSEESDYDLVADIIGVSRVTVFRALCDDPLKYQRKYIPVPKTTPKGHYRKVTPLLLEAMVEAVINCYRSFKQPVAKDVLREIQLKYPNQGNLSVGTIRFALKNQGFSYKKTIFNKELLEGKDDIQLWKIRFLQEKRRRLYFTLGPVQDYNKNKLLRHFRSRRIHL